MTPRKPKNTKAQTELNKRKVLIGLESGTTLTKVCAALGIKPPTVLKWVHASAEYGEAYMRAREIGFTLMADQILDIADDARNDFLGPQGNLHGSVVLQRARIRIDTRKFLLAKMLPTVFGDRIQIDGNKTVSVDKIEFITIFEAEPEWRKDVVKQIEHEES